MGEGETAHGPTAFFLLFAMSLAGAVANARCAVHIRNTFPIDKVAIFNLAFLDSAVCAAGNAVFVLSHIIANFTRNEVACTVRIFALVIPSLVGLLVIAEVAVIR